MMNRVSLNLSTLSIQPKMPAPSPLPPIQSQSPTLSSSYYQESDIFEDIPITLKLPDGITFKLIVKTGETVQEIKRKLDTLHGIPYSDATLYYNETCMIDPLSLNDFPGLVCNTNVCLDVKISSAWKPRDNVQYTSPQTGTGMHKNEYVDIGVGSGMVNTTSTSSLTSISFVEYVDATSSNISDSISRSSSSKNIDNLVSTAADQQDFYGEQTGSPPPLPNTFSDSPNTSKMNRRRPESEATKTGTTTIDINDDDPQCKDIQKLSGNSTKRWKFCFLF